MTPAHPGFPLCGGIADFGNNLCVSAVKTYVALTELVVLFFGFQGFALG